MEAASLAWLPLGWQCAFVSEIDKAPCALLAQRFPETPNFGDMTQFKDWPDAAIDVLVGGTPCQSFSIAGLRKGLADPRGSLMLVFGAIARRYRPRWIVWENVPGVLSADEGRAFGAFLGMLGELGYGFAYRILDAQYFGLAQRRARVFVVGYLGDWRPPAAVLFERESLRGDSPPRRGAGQDLAGGIDTSAGGSDENDAEQSRLVAHTLNAHGGASGRIDAENETFVTHALRADGFDASEDGTGRGTPIIAIQAGATRENPDSGPNGVGVQESIAYTLEARAEVQAVAFSCKDHGADAGEIAPTLRAMGHADSHANAGGQLAVAFALRGRDGGAQVEIEGDGDKVGALRAAGGGSSRDYVADYAVRRLTPTECERLQGAPDGHTAIMLRGKPIADGPRYKMIGNSMAAPVMRWIGERIALVNAALTPP